MLLKILAYAIHSLEIWEHRTFLYKQTSLKMIWRTYILHAICGADQQQAAQKQHRPMTALSSHTDSANDIKTCTSQTHADTHTHITHTHTLTHTAHTHTTHTHTPDTRLF